MTFSSGRGIISTGLMFRITEFLPYAFTYTQEKKELEEQRITLMEEVQSYRNRITQLEDDLLFRLSNSQVGDTSTQCKLCIPVVTARAWIIVRAEVHKICSLDTFQTDQIHSAHIKHALGATLHKPETAGDLPTYIEAYNIQLYTKDARPCRATF